MSDRYIYLLNRKHTTLALAEAEACCLARGTVQAPGVVEGDRPVEPGAAAFVRCAAQIVARGDSVSGVCDRLRAAGLSADAFRIEVERSPRALPINTVDVTREIADAIEGQPDLDAPRERFLLVATDQEYWFGRCLPTREATWQRFRHKPCAYSHAIPVHVGRAALSLTAQPGDTVFDPCCGSGTLLLLAHDMGCTVMGCDINRKVAYMAVRNAAHFSCDAEVWSEDGTKTKRTADAVVTNLAYGRRCPIRDDTVRALLENFRRLAPRVTVITTQDIDRRVAELGYTVDACVPASTHTVTRRVYVMRSPMDEETG